MSENFPGSDLEHNYCRNPDGEATIWCYTQDPRVRWEFCTPRYSQDGKLITTKAPKGKVPVTVGEAYQAYELVPYSYGDDDAWWKEHEGDDYGFGNTAMEDFEEIKLEDCNEAFSEADAGKTYRGCQTHTKTGKTCQAWSVQVPHQHDRFTENFPGAGLKTHNYCRNPDGEAGIWCYTTDTATRWEYCSPLPVHSGGGAVHLTEADKVKQSAKIKPADAKGKKGKKGDKSAKGGNKAAGMIMLLAVVGGIVCALKSQMAKSQPSTGQAGSSAATGSATPSQSGGGKYTRVAGKD